MSSHAEGRSGPRSVAILIYDEVEVLDFAAPFEVFSVAGRRHGLNLFNVFTVALSAGEVRARNNLRIVPAFPASACPRPDVLIVPGGYGSRFQMKNAETVDWVRTIASEAELVFSVCTGALILAASGLLHNRPATTHHLSLTALAELDPSCTVLSQRVVDAGHVVSAAGVSAGLDGSLHVVARLAGPELARECADYIEYAWQPDRAAPLVGS